MIAFTEASCASTPRLHASARTGFFDDGQVNGSWFLSLFVMYELVMPSSSLMVVSRRGLPSANTRSTFITAFRHGRVQRGAHTNSRISREHHTAQFTWWHILAWGVRYGDTFIRFVGRALLSCCWTGIRGADIDCERLAKGRGAMYNGIAVRDKYETRIGSHDDGKTVGTYINHTRTRCRARCHCGWRYGVR